MSLREQLRADMAASMRSGETLRRDTIRMALSALSLVEKEQKHDATDEETLTVLVKAVKTRRESVDAYVPRIDQTLPRQKRRRSPSSPSTSQSSSPTRMWMRW